MTKSNPVPNTDPTLSKETEELDRILDNYAARYYQLLKTLSHTSESHHRRLKDSERAKARANIQAYAHSKVEEALDAVEAQLDDDFNRPYTAIENVRIQLKTPNNEGETHNAER